MLSEWDRNMLIVKSWTERRVDRIILSVKTFQVFIRDKKLFAFYRTKTNCLTEEKTRIQNSCHFKDVKDAFE